MAFWNRKKEKLDFQNGEDGDGDFQKEYEKVLEQKAKNSYAEKKPESEPEKSQEERDDYFDADPELFGNWMSRSSMKRHDEFTNEIKESLMTQEELEAKRKEEQKNIVGGAVACPYCRKNIFFGNAADAGKELDRHIAKEHPDKMRSSIAKERIKLDKVI